MDAFLTSTGLLALVTLTFLEIVLGVDNVIFISILSGKLPLEQQPRARRLGLLGAMVTRVLLLFSLAWIIRLTAPWFAVWGHEISGRDLILIGGGLFLLGKSTYEIHDKLEGEEGHGSAKVAASGTPSLWTAFASASGFSSPRATNRCPWALRISPCTQPQRPTPKSP